MAIIFRNKVGTMTVTQGNSKTKHKVSIWTGNCLAIFNTEGKDERTGQDMYYLYMFLMDEKHAANIVKNHGSIFGDKISNIRINCETQDAKKIADTLIKYGYTVTCYTKQTKKK